MLQRNLDRHVVLKVDEKPNLLNQDFSADKPNKKWVGDITYIHTVKHGWCYLAAVLDLCTKKIVGYSFGRTMDAKLVVAAIHHVLKRAWLHFTRIWKTIHEQRLYKAIKKIQDATIS